MLLLEFKMDQKGKIMVFFNETFTNRNSAIFQEIWVQRPKNSKLYFFNAKFRWRHLITALRQECTHLIVKIVHFAKAVVHCTVLVKLTMEKVQV